MENNFFKVEIRNNVSEKVYFISYEHDNIPNTYLNQYGLHVSYFRRVELLFQCSFIARMLNMSHKTLSRKLRKLFDVFYFNGLICTNNEKKAKKVVDYLDSILLAELIKFNMRV